MVITEKVSLALGAIAGGSQRSEFLSNVAEMQRVKRFVSPITLDWFTPSAALVRIGRPVVGKGERVNLARSLHDVRNESTHRNEGTHRG
jgi:hypothetical protein